MSQLDSDTNFMM